ncbi:conserved exported hypothetical protein [Paraburkholderia tropica]|uniref:XAC2610-related protein n=1 Tax=Paraburkholderia tropica TaxID=92647 RepID=UPI001CB269D2|nr:hypothetical protein [Paraburkholderia tropica]CAG9200293.1 conserved exported hypothetical protein [Paraburkholderia tropica]
MTDSTRLAPARRLALALAAGCALGGAAQPASAAQAATTIKIDDTTRAQITRIDGTHVRVRILPDGATQTLEVKAVDEDGHFGIESADYNFDGHRDLSFAATLGQVNREYQIFLYDDAQRRFEPLRMASEKGPNGNCDGLWNISPDPKTHVLNSSCRGGPMWYTDAWRYRADGRLYLYQADAPLPDEVNALFGLPEDSGPDSILITYDETGHVVAREAQVYGGGKATMKVKVARLPLHERAQDTPTKRYVVAGDILDVLDVSDDGSWLKVRYTRPSGNPQAHAVTGWVAVSEAAATP